LFFSSQPSCPGTMFNCKCTSWLATMRSLRDRASLVSQNLLPDEISCQLSRLAQRSLPYASCLLPKYGAHNTSQPLLRSLDC
jgi:hypothetical protein